MQWSHDGHFEWIFNNTPAQEIDQLLLYQVSDKLCVCVYVCVYERPVSERKPYCGRLLLLLLLNHYYFQIYISLSLY